jgi:hypothetical protein
MDVGACTMTLFVGDPMARNQLTAAISALVLTLTPSLGAQATAKPATAWRVIPDAGATADVKLATMPPGWHLTAGTGAIAFDQGNRAGGAFQVQSELFLFSSAPEAAVGLLIGGRLLGAAGPRYTTFVISPDGRYRITRYASGTARDLVPWTTSAAIKRHPGGEANVRNALGVTVDHDAVKFTANGTVLATLDRDAIHPDGIVGLRAESGANAHVASFAINDADRAPPAPPR